MCKVLTLPPFVVGVFSPSVIVPWRTNFFWLLCVVVVVADGLFIFSFCKIFNNKYIKRFIFSQKFDWLAVILAHNIISSRIVKCAPAKIRWFLLWGRKQEFNGEYNAYRVIYIMWPKSAGKYFVLKDYLQWKTNVVLMSGVCVSVMALYNVLVGIRINVLC